LSGDAKLFKQLSNARVENVLLHRAPLGHSNTRA
jgi:hypothetical protein